MYAQQNLGITGHLEKQVKKILRPELRYIICNYSIRSLTIQTLTKRPWGHKVLRIQVIQITLFFTQAGENDYKHKGPLLFFI